MADEVRLPTTIEELIADPRMDQIHLLLTAQQWERAAIVYAFTGLGGPYHSPNHHPDPPKVTIREFALLNLKGLTTVKAVRRYRRAWEWAIAQGYAEQIGPGDVVVLPEVEFPAWSNTMTEYLPQQAVVDGLQPPQHWVFDQLNLLRLRVDQVRAKAHRLTEEQRAVALDYLVDLEDAVARLRDVLTGEEITPAQAAAAQERWKEF